MTMWHLHGMDVVPPCPQILNRSTEVHYFVRRVVEGRSYNATTKQANLGVINNFADWRTYASSPVRGITYPVRTDVVESLEEVLNKEDGKEIPLVDRRDVVSRKRPLDVAHFWPAPSGGRRQGVDRGGRQPNSQYRDDVSLLLNKMSQQKQCRAFAGLAGSANEQGRKFVSLDYAQALLQYKIVVVVQKDMWEGHFRLMEAMISGALVISDEMLSLPPYLKDGGSIVTFTTLDELRETILYFLKNEAKRLEIAQRGFDLVLRRHRSWHGIEEMVFGRPLGPTVSSMQTTE